ncbi:MAG: trigger factor [Proteobacteria bacterium]|nr:trigger factor [Pseudomonadota bacterium]
MNVTVETLGPCKKLLRVELDAAAVDAAFDSVTKEYQRHAQLPGFRPGKAPRDLIVKSFGPRIEEEVKKKLIPDSYQKALDQEKIRAAVYPDIEEIQFGRGQPLQFAATVETQPEFELPEYKGLHVKRETVVITDADVDKAIGVLREQRTDYKDVARPLVAGDIAVVNYTGTVDGKPITDTAPTARGLTEQKAFWIRCEAGQFIPGFTEQLHGMNAGEKRTVTVDFPADFVSAELVGKKGVYEVELAQVKERVMPEVNDEFAKSFGAESLEKLRAGIHQDLANDRNDKASRAVRDSLIQTLASKVTFDLPESIVLQTTRNVVYSIVQENQQRGIPKEAIEQQKDAIFANANASAKDRVKAMFLLNRIAEKEGVKVEQQEILERVQAMAQQYQMPIQKLIKQIEERNGFGEIHEQILVGKVLDFLQLQANIKEVPASTPAPAA